MRVHSPSNTQRITAIAATAVILLLGGWLASAASDPARAATTSDSATGHTSEGAVHASSVAENAAEASNPAATANTLTVSVSGQRSASGMLHVAVFDDASAFAASDFYRAVDVRSLPASTSAQQIAFAGLGAGPFAISVHHDENANEEFDMEGAYPLEGYGTSRATSAYDEPSFAEASVPAGDVSVQVFYIE